MRGRETKVACQPASRSHKWVGFSISGFLSLHALENQDAEPEKMILETISSKNLWFVLVFEENDLKTPWFWEKQAIAEIDEAYKPPVAF